MHGQAKSPEDLLPLVYAAATDQNAWGELCKGLNRLTGTPTLLFSHDITSHKSLGQVGAGWDGDHLDNYEKHFGRDPVNPWMGMNNALPIGIVGVSDFALGREELFKTEFYNDWLRPQDNLVVGSATICYRKQEKFLALSSACSGKTVEKTLPKVIHALEVLGPHVARAIKLSCVLMNGNDGSVAHLKNSRHAIIAVRKNGGIGNINPAAERLFRNCPTLTLSCNGKLSSCDDDVRNYIENALRAMETETCAVPLNPLALRDPVFGTFLMHAHVFAPAAQVSFPETIWHDPLIGCFIITGEMGLEEQSVVDVLVSGFGATPAEARLGQAIMNAQTLYEYAEQNTLSQHTVRNQMRALLSKTASRNQTVFVLKIARLISPFSHF